MDSSLHALAGLSSAVEVFSVAAAFFLVQCGSIKIFDIEEINK